MIRYALSCRQGHDFEAWFRSSNDYDQQRSDEIILCPSCGSHDVEKAIMAPNVCSGAKKDNFAEAANRTETGSAEPAKMTELPGQTEMHGLNLPDPKQLVDVMREYRNQITQNAEHVGDKFADEARKIHYEEAPDRGIYGNATPEEVSDLKDEGIDIAPLPVLPEDSN